MMTELKLACRLHLSKHDPGARVTHNLLGDSPFLQLHHTLCSQTWLCASCPLKKDLWADWRREPHGGGPGLCLQSADRWQDWAAGDIHLGPVCPDPLPFSRCLFLLFPCLTLCPLPGPHPRFLAPLPGKLLILLGDHIEKQKWVCGTKS